MTTPAEIAAKLSEAQPWRKWSDERPADHKSMYRWRVPARMILGLELAPEWSGKMHFCGPHCIQWRPS